MGQIDQWLWRKRCPRSVDSAANDFVERRMTPEGLAWLRDAGEEEIFTDATLSLRRRIAFIYGLAKDGSWEFDWNTELLNSTESSHAEEATFVILRKAQEIAKRSQKTL